MLTTLGVYIGLLMAGSAPGVVAQQAGAMTRNFDVKDEIEIKDDLDNKPDGCNQARERNREFLATYLWFNDASFYEFSNLIESFGDAYPENKYPIGEFTLTLLDLERPFRNTFLYGPSPLNADLGKTLASEFLIAANGLPGKTSELTVSRTALGTDFRFESSSFPQDTPLVRYLYSNAFHNFKCGSLLESDELFFKNTQLAVQNNSFVISTRLPRGSLDALLADAK